MMSAPAYAGTQYLTLQLFTRNDQSHEMQISLPPQPENLRATVKDMGDRIGTTGDSLHKLGFVLGPLALDDSDEQTRKLIQQGFDISLETNTAVGFHIDDSMFWGLNTKLDKPENIEWLDWNRTPNTGRRLDWSTTPLKIKPQLCFNSPDVKAAVAARANVIGQEIALGIQKLEKAGKKDLYVGVIAGWETQIGRDYETGKPLGYCALTNNGYSASKPPADIDKARSDIVMDFISLWADALIKGGAPKDKIYSHIAYMSEQLYDMEQREKTDPESYVQAINFTPPATAFCKNCIPGISTYPQPGHLEQMLVEVQKNGNPGWASCEGTAMDPAAAERREKGMGMENYLGNLFNQGAVLVNIFGWDVGEKNNPFREAAENSEAIAAYKKFLTGAKLEFATLPVPSIPPKDLPDRIHEIQAKLPQWIEKNGPSRVQGEMESLDQFLKAQRFQDASKKADEILAILSEQK